jgi:hypothetical protein
VLKHDAGRVCTTNAAAMWNKFSAPLARQKHLWSDTTPAQPIGREANQNRTQTERDRHGKQMKHHGCPIEALNVGEPLRRPESL